MSDKDVALNLAFMTVVGGALVATSLYYRYKRRELDHRERMAAIEKGAELPALPSDIKPWTPRVYLLRGLVWLFTGLALMAFLGATAMSTNRETPADFRVDAALRAKAKGASEDQVREILNERRHEGMPVAIALLGLINCGVGLAYLITYRAENKQST